MECCSLLAGHREITGGGLRADGKVPPNVDNVELDKIRAATLRLPIDADWKMASEAARQAVFGKPIAGDMPMIL